MFDIDDVDEAKRMLPIYKRAVDLLETVSGKKTEQAEQEPVAWLSEGGDVSRSKKFFDDMGFKSSPLYAAPIRTKDLTDDEIRKLWSDAELDITWFARAVIAKLREKNS